MNPEKILFELHGRNHWRYFCLLMLLSIIGFSIYLIHILGFFILLATISTIWLISAIQFPVLYIYSEYIVIEKKSIISKLSEKEIIEFHKIESVRFSKSYTNWSRLLIQSLLGAGGSGGFSKSDQLIIYLKDGSSKSFKRIGSREKFKDAIQLIRKKII